jgi:hypothetical protein
MTAKLPFIVRSFNNTSGMNRRDRIDDEVKAMKEIKEQYSSGGFFGRSIKEHKVAWNLREKDGSSMNKFSG